MAKLQSSAVKTDSHKPLHYIYVDEFLETAKYLYPLNKVNIAGFKAHMVQKPYQTSMKAFQVELEKYLGLTKNK